MENMNNIMYFKDEQGNELPLLMIDAFDVEDTPYALFATPESELKPGEQPSLYIMKVIYDKDEMINFEMPTDEEMEKVTPVINQRLEAMSQHAHSCSGHCHSCGCGCEEEHDDEDCGCDDDHCGCGHCH